MTKETPMKKCQISGMYGKDNNKNLHFYCEFCGEEMGYDEDRVCSVTNKLPNKEECKNCRNLTNGSIVTLEKDGETCTECGRKFSPITEIPVSPSDKTWEDKVRRLISFYPTTFNGKPFMIPVGWSEKMAEDLIGYIKEQELLSVSDKTLEAVAEDWNKQASELSETYDIKKPSVTSDKTREDKIETHCTCIHSDKINFICKECHERLLTSATIKARQEGYSGGYKQGRFDVEADREFRPEEPNK